MGGDFVLLAAAETFQREVEAARAGGQIETNGVLIAVSIGVAVGAILFAAVYIYYRRKNAKEGQRSRISKSKPRSSKPVEKDDGLPEEGSDPERRRVRKRRRKRDHRPRNPTLDKTGGLPPLRPDDELPKF